LFILGLARKMAGRAKPSSCDHFPTMRVKMHEIHKEKKQTPEELCDRN
jgi:hypothetical protein